MNSWQCAGDPSIDQAQEANDIMSENATINKNTLNMWLMAPEEREREKISRRPNKRLCLTSNVLSTANAKVKWPPHKKNADIYIYLYSSTHVY